MITICIVGDNVFRLTFSVIQIRTFTLSLAEVSLGMWDQARRNSSPGEHLLSQQKHQVLVTQDTAS